MLVLILIVVDNGLVLTIEAWMQGIAKVLILIVVDNGLVPRAVYKLAILKGCLNPYCSGQWSRTHLVLRYSLMRRVLILIVVDNGLVLKSISVNLRVQNVLILIVVDNGLVRLRERNQW